MAKLKPAQIAEVKGKGFLINRGTENFSGRIAFHDVLAVLFFWTYSDRGYFKRSNTFGRKLFNHDK